VLIFSTDISGTLGGVNLQ